MEYASTLVEFIISTSSKNIIIVRTSKLEHRSKKPPLQRNSVSGGSSQKDEQLPFKRDGKDTGGVISPCYSGTPYSIADKVGLGQVGEFNEKGDELIGGIGSTGINHTGGNGFAQNHK